LANPAPFTVVRHAAFSLSLKKLAKKHSAVESDVEWLEGRLKMNPMLLGTPIPNLKLALPVYKTRLKDSCCRVGASGGWRIIYAINAEKKLVTLILIYHKRELENPSNEYLQQTLGAALAEGIKAQPQNPEKSSSLEIPDN
jgi:mRNA-degrading endonuclease RelE of RelBE toxin-antitoxin system